MIKAKNITMKLVETGNQQFGQEGEESGSSRREVSKLMRNKGISALSVFTISLRTQ